MSLVKTYFTFLLLHSSFVALGSEVMRTEGEVKFQGQGQVEYLEKIIQGICQAKCLLKQPNIQLPSLDEESGIFTNGVHCGGGSNSSSCHSSTLPKQLKMGDGFDGGKFRCGGEVSFGSLWLRDPVTFDPIFHCSTFRRERQSFDVYFRLEFTPHNSTLRNLSLTPESLPLLFLIQVEVGGELSLNSPQPITPSWLPVVTVPANETFRLRITPISSNGAYPPFYSRQIRLNPTAERGVYRSPKNLQVRRIRQNPLVDTHPDLQVLLHWESGNVPEDVTCAGLVWILDAGDKVRMYSEANETFWFNLTNQTKGAPLSFGTNYSIHIQEGSDVIEDDFSNSTDISIKLPPCLQFFRNNFTMCPPPPPKSVRFVVMPNNSVLASWAPPEHTSSTNLIESYQVRLIKFNLGSKGVSIPATAIHHATQLANVTVSGTTTSVLFRNVSHGQLIQVLIRAFSKGGPSGLTFDGPHPPLDFTDSVGHKFLMVGLVFVSLTLLTVTAFVLKVRKAKRERRRARAKYFGDEQDENYLLECPYFPAYCSKWLIDTNCLKMGELIGEGNFGQVHAATLYKSQTSRIVAVKTLKEGVNLGEKSKFWEEFQILKNLEPHPHVVRLIGIVKAHYPTLVVEYCDGGDLHSYLRTLRDDKFKRLAREKRRIKWMTSGTISGEFLRQANGSYSGATFVRYIKTAGTGESPLNGSVVTNETYFYSKDEELDGQEKDSLLDPVELNLFVSFGRQVAAGMEFLANNKIVHRDLAARNILVMHESKPVLKIADFGLSRDVYEKNWYKKSSDEKIPIKWLALECLLDEVYTTKSDVWSYGVLLWEIVTYGGSPYPGIKNSEIFEFLKKGYRMSQPAGCPSELYALMRRTWVKDAEARPDFPTLRHCLDDMMERAQGSDYFRLLDNETSAQGQRSPDGTLEADVQYSSLLLPGPLSEQVEMNHSLGRINSPPPPQHQPITYSENLLYSSLDSNSAGKEPTGLVQSRKSSSSTSLYELHIPYDPQGEPQYENEFCLFNINEKGLKLAIQDDSPFEFEREEPLPKINLQNSPTLHLDKGEKAKMGARKQRVPAVVFV